MSKPLDPVRPADPERRQRERRQMQRRQAMAVPALLQPPQPAPEEPKGDAVFTAQVLGQSGQKRGLKGGPPVLEQARSAYLGAAFSGPLDRRPRPGRVTKTEI